MNLVLTGASITASFWDLALCSMRSIDAGIAASVFRKINQSIFLRSETMLVVPGKGNYHLQVQTEST